MKKNTKMADNAKKKLEKEKELERLSNKELIIFSMGLVAEVILLYFYSALKSAVRKDAEVILMWMAGIFFVGFAALLVTSILSAKKNGKTKKSVSLKNWSFCSLAFSVGSFIIPAGNVIREAVQEARIKAGQDIALHWSRKLYYFDSRSMAEYVMIAVAVYVVAAMIYYAIKSYKVKKS